MKLKNILVTSAAIVLGSYSAQAAVTAAQAQALGTTLTQFGAEVGGSADGAIPPYTGGISALTGLPKSGDVAGYPDPFANEKPLYSITPTNMAQYAGQLTPGAQALLQRYPDYRIDVYTTHRTFSYPNWVLKNTLANATTAQLTDDSEGITGAYGGIPFPIPQNGYEVMWNSFLRYHPAICTQTFENYLVDEGGSITDLGNITTEAVEPYYDPTATATPGNFWGFFQVLQNSPVAEAGTQYLFQYPISFAKSDDVTWFYAPGTRRVRLAPEFKYDTPIASYGGAINYDEIELFYGEMNKFNFRLVGKKEMIIPYNDFKIAGTTQEALLGPHTLNPDGLRWEKHRVWVVDATLKAGERHSFSRWTFYIDEDSWTISATDSYDNGASMYKVGFAYPYPLYGQGDATNFSTDTGIYDLSKGDYQIAGVQLTSNPPLSCSTTLPNMSLYTPQAMSATAVR